MLFITHFAIAIAANVLLAPSQAVLATEASAPSTIGELEDSQSSMPLHGFMGTWTFETEEDLPETPLLLQQVQAAFLMAANEVHDISKMRYNSMFLKSAMHEKVHTRVHGKSSLGDTEEIAEVSTAVGNLRGMFANEFDEDDEDDLGYSGWYEFNRWRWRHGYATYISCTFCLGMPDPKLPSTVSDFLLPGNFYLTDEGKSIKDKWQKRFCSKLKRIPGLKNPNRCFIFMDMKHEIPATADLDDLVFAPSD